MVAVAVVLIVVMMVVPLPARLLDLLLAFNMAFALIVLLVTMYTSEPLEFSIFPSLLLITTLYRLALNVSSTRLILLQGYAGEIINRFGEFVVGGNPVVGFVVFLILVIIQFVVITRGAERVAEVAARFTLDAMPGKQMSIDADLNAGLITDQEARRRRREIEQEADFYGAMDGASKFVKGDAIAGLIITAINLIGGLAVGMLQRGLPLEAALRQYALLTVGDGLVTQIPALLIATATGIVVTRAASQASLGADLVSQISAQPRVLLVAGGVLLLFALVPGLPHLPFLVLSGAVLGLGWTMQNTARVKAAREEAGRRKQRDRERQPESVLKLLRVEPLEVELGYALIPLADPEKGGDLLDRVVMIRRQLALDLGLMVPPVRVRDNLQELEPNEYCIRLRGVEIARACLLPDHYLAMSPGEVEEELEGVPTREPAFGLPALWIPESERSRAELAGYTVVDPTSVLATHLAEIIKRHAHELLGRQEVQTLLDHVKETHPAVVEELIPDLLTVGEVQKVLRNLLRENVSIRDLVTILEALADHARTVRDPDELTEKVRAALSRVITRQFGLHENPRVITLDPEVERLLSEAVEDAREGREVVLPPDKMRAIVQSLGVAAKKAAAKGHPPVVVCSPEVRPLFRKLAERILPRLAVLSYVEVEEGLQLESVGVVSFESADQEV